MVALAAIVLFTSFLIRYAFGLDLAVPVVAGTLMAACASILVAVLAASTLAAAAMAVPRVDPSTLRLWPTSGESVPLVFLLALVGWMPAPLELAAWSSLWTLAKREATGKSGTIADARLDFNIGYAGTWSGRTAPPGRSSRPASPVR